MLKFYVRHGMVVEKIHEIVSFKQSKCLEKDFYKLLHNAFYGKTMENVRNGMRLDFFKKDDIKNIIEQQSKITFNGFHKSYEICDSYLFRKSEVLMDEPNFLGSATLELSKLPMYETYYDNLQPYSGQGNFQKHYIDTDAFVLSMNTKDSIKDFRKIEDKFDFRNLDKNHELFSNKNKKVIGKFKIETPKNFWTDEFVCKK